MQFNFARLGQFLELVVKIVGHFRDNYNLKLPENDKAKILTYMGPENEC